MVTVWDPPRNTTIVLSEGSERKRCLKTVTSRQRRKDLDVVEQEEKGYRPTSHLEAERGDGTVKVSVSVSGKFKQSQKPKTKTLQTNKQRNVVLFFTRIDFIVCSLF